MDDFEGVSGRYLGRARSAARSYMASRLIGNRQWWARLKLNAESPAIFARERWVVANRKAARLLAVGLFCFCWPCRETSPVARGRDDAAKSLDPRLRGDDGMGRADRIPGCAGVTRSEAI